MTTRSGTPAARRIVAAEWRRSWKRRPFWSRVLKVIRQAPELRTVGRRRCCDPGESTQPREQIDDPLLEVRKHDDEKILEEGPFDSVLFGQCRNRLERSSMRLLREPLSLASTAPGRDADPSTGHFAVARQLEGVDDCKDFVFVLRPRLVEDVLAIIGVLAVVVQRRCADKFGRRSEQDRAEHFAHRAVDLPGAVANGVARGFEDGACVDEAAAVAVELLQVRSYATEKLINPPTPRRVEGRRRKLWRCKHLA